MLATKHENFVQALNDLKWKEKLGDVPPGLITVGLLLLLLLLLVIYTRVCSFMEKLYVYLREK